MNGKHATRVPTVLIGIGGIGGEIVRQVKKSLKEYDMQFVKMVVLDTNTNDLEKSIGDNIQHIQTSENMTVSDYLRQNPEFLEWFPTNPLINAKNLTQGAGQIRSVSRLGALASEDGHCFDTLSNLIEAVNQNVGNPLHNMIRVMIVGSVCGGTGSGMGIQLPFLVRDLIEDIAHLPRTIIRGLFLMPDILEEVQDTDEKKSSVYVNGYAFLRELNAFHKSQTFQPGTDKLNIEHYHRDDTDIRDDPAKMSHQIPYDFLFLVEKSDTSGQNIGGFDAYLEKAAQIVKAQLFASGITSNVFSSEDNQIVAAVDKLGVNRYCGAGVSKIIYPEDENMRYCTLRFTESLVRSYWLRIDRKVEANIAQHKMRMATDPTLLPKNEEEEYNRVFDEITSPKNPEFSSEMGLLRRDLITEVEDDYGNRTPINKARALFSNIENYLEDRYNSKMANDASNCKIKKDELYTEDAENYCDNKLESLKGYRRKADEYVTQIISDSIETILGSNYDLIQSQLDEVKSKSSICAFLRNRHPIVARYFLYYLRKELKKSIDLADSQLQSLDLDKDTIFTKNYSESNKKGKGSEEEKDLDHASDALSKTTNKKARGRLVEKIVRDANSFIASVDEFSLNTLKKEVYDAVVNRIDLLIEFYEKFFDELDEIQTDCIKDIKRLEAKDGVEFRIRNSDIYVCSDSLCKRWLYDEFESNVHGEDTSLPDEIKHTFFDAIFKEYENKFKTIMKKTAFTKEPISMKKLFSTAILDPLTEKYEKKELAHVKMDVVSAIEREYDIHSQHHMLWVNNMSVNPANYDFASYFAAIVSQLKVLSTPYLSYHGISAAVSSKIMPSSDVSEIAEDPGSPAAKTARIADGRILCYWGINNSSVINLMKEDDLEKIEEDKLRKKFGNPDSETYFVINDDSFDERELVCYSSVYDLVIENLTKYEKDSRAYDYYGSRILRVINSDYRVGTGVSAYLDAVHPHLDRHWHAHSYLPMLHVDEEEEEQKRIARAFLLSVACSRVWYTVYDTKLCWQFKQTGHRSFMPLPLDGHRAERASFNTLFEIMDENTVAVNDVLRESKKDEEKVYNACRMTGIELNDVLKHPIISGFVGDQYSEDELKDLREIFDNIHKKNDKKRLPINILRVIYSVYQDSFDLELVIKLVNELTEYLNDYCMKMTNNTQPGKSEELVKGISKAIGENSGITDDKFIEICNDYFN